MASDVPTRVQHGDLSDVFFRSAIHARVVALDTETDGLDPRLHALRLVQVAVPDVGIEIVQVTSVDVPHNLLELLGSKHTTKVFHHATFDVAFCMAALKAEVSNIRCTKIAAKLLEPDPQGEHTLAGLVKRHLGVTLDKSEQTSDWRGELTPGQVAYAAADVRYLLDLDGRLREGLMNRNLLPLAEASWAYVPTRAALLLAGIGDVFTH